MCSHEPIVEVGAIESLSHMYCHELIVEIGAIESRSLMCCHELIVEVGGLTPRCSVNCSWLSIHTSDLQRYNARKNARLKKTLPEDTTRTNAPEAS